MLDYLPKRTLIFVLPVGFLAALFSNESSRLIFALYSVIMVIVQVSNYFYARYRHATLYIEYGDKYLQQLAKKLEEKGLNELVSSFWTGLEPDQNS